MRLRLVVRRTMRVVPIGLATLATLAALASAAAWSQPAVSTAASGEAAGPRFDILEFVVEGDTLLGAAAIERAVYPFLGEQRTAADAEAARRALEKAYQDAGYLSVTVVLPPQRVGDGRGEVLLQVLQAPVARLRVTGAEYHLPSLVREAVPSLAPGSVPNFNEMQDELSRLARSSADREITPLVTAGTRPGTMDVELKVQDSLPLHGSVELNTKQSFDTERGRLEAGLRYDNLFQRGHSIGLNWFYSPRRPDDANIQTLSYHFPLGGEGDRLYLLLTHSDSNTVTPVGDATASRGDTGRLRWRDELPAREGLSHALTWGLAYRNLRDRTVDATGRVGTPPALRYPSFSAGYELDLTGATAGRASRLQAELNFTLPGLSRREVDCFGTARDQFACKRADAPAGFQVLTLNLSHREPLGRWALTARLSSQITDVPLVSAEQAVYGGQDSVRGYLEGEQAGDLGAALRLELTTPAWAALDGATLRALVFHDRAELRRLYAQAPSEAPRTRLASAGLGLRLDTRLGLQATLDWARVLYDTTRFDAAAGRLVPVSGSAAGRSQRVEFGLRQNF